MSIGGDDDDGHGAATEASCRFCLLEKKAAACWLPELRLRERTTSHLIIRRQLRNLSQAKRGEIHTHDATVLKYCPSIWSYSAPLCTQLAGNIWPAR